MSAAPQRGFGEAEYRHRLSRAQTMMAKAGLACLLLSTEPEVRYFTGYLTRFWGKPGASVVFDCPCCWRSDCCDPIHWRGFDVAQLDQGYPQLAVP